MNSLREEFQSHYENSFKDKEKLARDLIKLARIVVKRYAFNVPVYAKEDLKQEAILKAWSLIVIGRYNPELGMMYSYLFTGMRNAIQNVKVKKRDVLDIEEGITDVVGSISSDVSDDLLSIENRNSLYDLCGQFPIFSLLGMSVEQQEDFFKILLYSKKEKATWKVFEGIDTGMVLRLAFTLSGETLRFPSLLALERMARRVKLYYLAKRGLSCTEIAKRLDIRKVHIKRILGDTEEILGKLPRNKEDE